MDFIEAMGYGFMQRGMLAAVIISLLCSVVSTFIVLKRLSFLGVGISHSAFGGTAIAIVTGWNMIITTLIFSAMVALGIGWVNKTARLAEDTAIGIFFSSMMAAGVVILGFAGSSVKGDVFGYLFGNVMSVSGSDLQLIAFLSAAVLGFVILFYKELVYFSFDEESARVAGLPVDFLHYFLLALLAVTIVVAMKVVGLILVSAMLVIPAATAMQLCKNIRGVMPTSIAVGLVSTAAGFYISYRLDIPSGGAIVLTAAGIFLMAAIFSPVIMKK